MIKKYKAYYHSEIGLLELTGTEESIQTLYFIENSASHPVGDGEKDRNFEGIELPPVIAAGLAQLDEYFRGERQKFELELNPAGTDFQKVVWRQLATIPYGQTVSYLDVARSIGNEKTIRAVGAANGQNPISIVIPCHRVIGSNGQLIGYGGGLWRKAWLLNHEKRFSSQQMALF